MLPLKLPSYFKIYFIYKFRYKDEHKRFYLKYIREYTYRMLRALCGKMDIAIDQTTELRTYNLSGKIPESLKELLIYCFGNSFEVEGYAAIGGKKDLYLAPVLDLETFLTDKSNLDVRFMDAIRHISVNKQFKVLKQVKPYGMLSSKLPEISDRVSDYFYGLACIYTQVQNNVVLLKNKMLDHYCASVGFLEKELLHIVNF